MKEKYMFMKINITRDEGAAGIYIMEFVIKMERISKEET